LLEKYFLIYHNELFILLIIHNSRDTYYEIVKHKYFSKYFLFFYLKFNAHLSRRYGLDLKVVLSKLYAIFHVVKLYLGNKMTIIFTLHFAVIDNFVTIESTVGR